MRSSFLVRLSSLLFLVLVLMLGLHQTALAQQAAKVFTASEFAALLAKQPADKNVGGQTFLGIGTYKVNMEHRVTGQGSAVHEKDAELFYVVDGAGTLVTGGKQVNEKRVNAANLSGTAIEGGVTTRVSKGDFILVPQGVPHQFTAVEGALSLMSLHLPIAPQ